MKTKIKNEEEKWCFETHDQHSGCSIHELVIANCIKTNLKLQKKFQMLLCYIKTNNQHKETSQRVYVEKITKIKPILTGIHSLPENQQNIKKKKKHGGGLKVSRIKKKHFLAICQSSLFVSII